MRFIAQQTVFKVTPETKVISAAAAAALSWLSSRVATSGDGGTKTLRDEPKTASERKPVGTKKRGFV